MTDDIKVLFQNNRDWVDQVNAEDPEFFNSLANQQSPEYMWIGCSDSRVPANQILGLAPGEVFVHRNIANVVVYSDLNCLSVVQFAVDVLKVKHITIVGHYGCGGVRAALLKLRVGLADNWIRHVQDVASKHERYLGSILREEEAHDKLCELNVIEQVKHLCETTVIQDAWDRGQSVTIHGWVYGVSDGLIRELGMSVANNDQLHERLELAYQQYSVDAYGRR